MIQQIINSNIKDDLNISTELLNYDGHFIFAIKIPATNNVNRPFMVKRQIGKLKENQMFIRKGSSTLLPTKSDLQLMMNIVKSSKLTIKSFSEKIEEKIVLNEINNKIRKYNKEIYQKLVDKSIAVINLKSNKFSFADNSMFLKDEKIEIEEETKKHIMNWFAKIELEDLILEYVVIKNYSEKLPTIYVSNLLIENDGTYMDEDVELKLIIKEDYFDYKKILLDDYDVGYLGNLFENIKDEFKYSNVSYIDNYDYLYIPSTNISAVKYPMIFGKDYKPSYLDKVKDKAIDFENELENMYSFEKYTEGNTVILKFYFKKIMHNSRIFLQSKLLFLNQNIEIDYEIKSKNNKDIIYATITS